MLTNDEKRMLRVVAAYNDCTEEQAEKAIVKTFLSDLLNDDKSAIALLGLPIVEKVDPVKDLAEKVAPIAKVFDSPIEIPEQKIRKKPGRKPKNFVEDTIREVKQNEKMSKDEFVEFFGGGKA